MGGNSTMDLKPKVDKRIVQLDEVIKKLDEIEQKSKEEADEGRKVFFDPGHVSGSCVSATFFSTASGTPSHSHGFYPSNATTATSHYHITT